MRFADTQFLLVSRNARFSPGTPQRQAHALAVQEARRAAAARADKQARPQRTVRSRVTGPVRAAFGGGRDRA
jgi:hypothetical protein